MATEPWKRPWEDSHLVAPIGKSASSLSPTISRRLPPLDAGLVELQQHPQQQNHHLVQPHNHIHNHAVASAAAATAQQQQQPPPPSPATPASGPGPASGAPADPPQRRASLEFETAQWQQHYEHSAANKRRRLLLSADQHSAGPPPNAYSSLPQPEHASSPPPRRELSHPQHSQAGAIVPDGHDTTSTAAADLREATRECCPPGCHGAQCRSSRSIVAELTAEFAILDLQLHGAIAAHDSAAHSPRPPPDSQKPGGTHAALEWMLERIRSNNEGIRSLTTTSKDGGPPHEPKIEPPSASTEAEVADSTPTEDMSKDSYWPRQPPGRQVTSSFPSLHPEGSSGSSYGPASPENPSSSSATLQSPHPRALPSLQQQPLPPPLPLPSAQQSPAQYSATYQKSSSPAHMQHFQDLQHQVTVKTLALQTLQREYDALLAKLERQRTKCLTLEKKFAVTDVEINALTDDRERLLSQVQTLEAQTEDLTKARDDARKDMAESGRQYIRIVEMANRLQAQSAEERKKWDDERKELTERIQMLEYEAAPPQRNGETLGSESDEAQGSATGGGNTKAAPHQAVRAEIGRLRARTAALEAILTDMRAENKTLQDSLAGITAYATRIQAAVDKALDV